MAGWIKLHRQILDSALWKDCNSNQKVILITCLLMADHNNSSWIYKGEKYTTEPGQFITSLQSIANESNCTVQVVRGALLKFEKYQFLTSKSTNKNRLITIINWSKYQVKSEDDNKGLNKHSTSIEQALNKQSITNKNIRIKELNYIYNSNEKNVDNLTKDKPNYLEWMKSNPPYKNETTNEHIRRWKEDIGFYENSEGEINE